MVQSVSSLNLARLLYQIVERVGFVGYITLQLERSNKGLKNRAVGFSGTRGVGKANAPSPKISSEI